MEVRAVLYHPEDVGEELYLKALEKVTAESQTRIKRYYRREDACRTLIGELLVRMYCQEHGLFHPIRLTKTAEGKPYIANQDPNSKIGFNVTHDNALVAVAFAPGIHGPPAFNIGIDVMKTKIPSREPFASFVEAFEEQASDGILLPHIFGISIKLTRNPATQLTSLEVGLLKENVSLQEKINRFFWMWTLKEAYTKALGLGLGFDFSRVEFDVVQKEVKIDGQAPKGWRFTMFTIPDDEDVYEGVVAEFVGGNQAQVLDRRHHHADQTELSDWSIVVSGAGPTMQKAVDILPSFES
ncbi:hypothetical protein CC1G_00093 [Coprinopsis cinerea okayama7|uniref:holo-[acyl-carrier-protein] synthase n=1 Tax=Coprinopsis cinerea (strain Okayama-7 / 130 / ATCC MYA-4618 / FGSC 9003) TaxID=240176 RepID=A8NWQ5_COPC7|nr:hypothetical protein CC1G_00093 [Coprinopsis cinerea okayama7\|eukprot:XP_001836957.2 hypothetical protein CC1G_00093 [Coprinopsis cinerea okayama7\